MNEGNARQRAIAGAVLLGTLLLGACGAMKGADNFNKPAVYEGPGCYDHKNRIERTITSKTDCDIQGWVWKTTP